MRYEIPQTHFFGSTPYLCPNCHGETRYWFKSGKDVDWDWCLYCDVTGWIEDNNTTLIVQSNRGGLIACPVDDGLLEDPEYLLTMTTEGGNDDLKAIIDMWFDNIQTIGGNIIDIEFRSWPAWPVRWPR